MALSMDHIFISIPEFMEKAKSRDLQKEESGVQ